MVQRNAMISAAAGTSALIATWTLPSSIHSRGGRHTPSFSLPALLDVPRVGYGHWGTNYDVSADGRRVYMLRPNTDRGPGEIHVVLGRRALVH